MRHAAVLVSAVVLGAAAVFAQAAAAPQPTPTFDVVSIRPSVSTDTGGRVGTQPGGRWLLVNASILSGGIAMATLARMLQGASGRVVADKTGLDGYYEFTLSFTETPGPNTNHADVFTALQEQLGLRLAPASGSVRVFVIDQIERPTDN